MSLLMRVAIGLPALAFIFVGFAWWISPEFIGSLFRMELLKGAGLSTQIADLASFFLTLGCCMLVGLLSRSPIWFLPAILLLSFAILGRLIAWLSHGADLTLDMIFVEVVVVLLLSISLSKLFRE